MARTDAMITVSIPAHSDLSSGQYYGVLVTTTGTVSLVAANGGDCDGVLQNDPAAAGRPAEVAVGGVCKARAGSGDVTMGDKVQCLSGGEFATAASGDHVIGKALTSAADNGIFDLLLVSKHILA